MSFEEIVVNDNLKIPWNEISLSYARSGGPGGQNVNKVNTKVFLRWNLSESSIPEEIRERILQRCASFITTTGEFLIYSTKSRSQKQNVEDCVANLQEILRKALHKKKKRVKTKVPKGVKEKRLKNKKIRSDVKKTRGKISLD